MKKICLLMLVSGITTQIAQAQGNMTSVVIESRVGYSTNTYLNPFFSEWNTSSEGPYGVFSIFGQQFWYKNAHSAEFTGGLVLEPLLGNHQLWKGGLGVARYNRRLSGRFTLGAETGGSYFSSGYKRTSAWIQPVLSWFPSPFTTFRLKAGSLFRSYSNDPDSLVSSSAKRFDLYALEYETWPGFQWQLTAGLYGQIQHLLSPWKGFSSTVSAAYLFRKGPQIRLYGALEQYQQSVTMSVSGPGPGLPFPGPPFASHRTSTTETDRMLRLGLSLEYPVGRKWSLFLKAERLGYYSTQAAADFRDIQVSGGIRLSFNPRLGSRRNTITPKWEKSETEQELRIHYKGEGRLYLTGDFNNWSKPGIPLRRRSEHLFALELHLEPGAYEYKILKVYGTDEEWVEISKDTYTVSDGFGGRNALLLVE